MTYRTRYDHINRSRTPRTPKSSLLKFSIFWKSQNFRKWGIFRKNQDFRKFSKILRFSKNRKFQQARFWGSGCAGSVSMVATRSIGHLAPLLQTLYSVSLPDRFSRCYRARKVKTFAKMPLYTSKYKGKQGNPMKNHGFRDFPNPITSSGSVWERNWIKCL